MSAHSQMTILDAEHCLLFARIKSHQAPIPVEDTIELTEQELEERSEKNVERWVSLHIIPVCAFVFHP